MEYPNVAAGGLRTSSARAVIFAFCWCGLILGGVYAWNRFTPRAGITFPAAALPRVLCDDEGIALQSPTGIVAADLATFDDQFSAFLGQNNGSIPLLISHLKELARSFK